jgi:hypothetical protein
MRKTLRLGVVLAGRIVDERLVRNRRAVCLGELGERPRSWKILVPTEDGWRLRLTAAMEARLAFADAAPRRVAGPTELALPSTARGKIVVGETTVLFQLVVAPPDPPRPQLPRSVRGSLASRIDPVLACVLLFSFIVHTGLGAWVYGLDLPRRPEPDEVGREFAVRTIPIPPPQPAVPATAEPSATPGPAAPASAPPAAAPRSGHGRPDAAVKEFDVHDTPLIRILGRKSDGSGRFFDVGAGKDPGEDLARSLGHTAKVRVAEPGLVGRDPGDADISGGKGTGPVGPADPRGVGPRREEAIVPPDIDVARPETLGGIDPSEVMSTIKQRYQRGIAECYRLALKRDGDAGGKLVLTLGIGSSGRVTRVAVHAPTFDGDLAQCVEDRARTWRFASGQEGDELEIPFVLRPGR